MCVCVFVHAHMCGKVDVLYFHRFFFVYAVTPTIFAV